MPLPPLGGATYAPMKIFGVYYERFRHKNAKSAWKYKNKYVYW